MLKQFRFVFLACAVLSVVFLAVGGCKSIKEIFERNKDSELDKKFEVPLLETEDGKPKLVGDCAAINNYSTVAVHGFGLVVGLPGTGGDDLQSVPYQEVYNDMNRRGISNIRTILASPETAVVAIVGYMHPGIQKGDRFDVDVMLPPDTNTKSLRGGRLLEAPLTERLGAQESSSYAAAAGPIMVEDPTATEASNPSGLKKGTILGGAIAAKPRALSLIMTEDSQFIAVTNQIAKEINKRFPMPSGVQKGVATAYSDVLIVLEIHPSYANDIPRYVRVIQSIACYETPAKQIRRIERLKEELLVPATSQHAAFQLEALGKAGIVPLQQALRSPDMEVRFHAATSLAYLGDSTPAKVLTEAARVEPAFRVYALNALSVMKNDLEAETHLRELLHVPSAETRYGAFRALKYRNPRDQTIRGEILGGQFSYHGINSSTVPMVHITTKKQPEVVLFGTDIFLRQPFAFDAGPFIYVNGQAQGEVVVSKFVKSGVDEERRVSNRLDAVIRAVADLGGTYPDVVQLLRQADAQGVLSCRLAINCLPEAERTYRRNGSDSELAEEEEEEKPKSFWSRLNPRNIFSPNPGEKSSDYMGTVNTSVRD